MSREKSRQAHKICLPGKTPEPGQHGKPRGKRGAQEQFQDHRPPAFLPHRTASQGAGASPRFSLQSFSRGTHSEAGWLARPTTPALVVGGAGAGSAAGLRDPPVQEAAPSAGHRTPSSTFLSRSWGVAPSWIPYQRRIWGEAWGQVCLRRAGNRVSCQNRCWGLWCGVNHLTTR